MVSAQWHLNPLTQRQSSAYPSTQWQSWASPLWGSHSASFFPSSFTVTPWLLITPLAQMGPERTAAIQGFQKALPMTEMVTLSPRITLVISKFKLLTKAVTTNMYHFASCLIGCGNGTGQFDHWCSGRGSLSGSLDKACILTNWSVLHLKPSWGNCGVSPLREASKWWGSGNTCLQGPSRVWVHTSNVSWGVLEPPACSSWVNSSQALDNILFGKDDMLLHPFF